MKEENKARNFAIIKERLEAFVSYFDTKHAPALYADHHAHVAVKEFVHSVAVARQSVGFET